MKKRIFNLLSLPLTLIVAIGFTSCSGNSENSENGSNNQAIEQIVQAAAKNTDSIKNYDFNMNMDYKMSITNDQSINGNAMTNGVVFSDPLKMKIDMQINVNESSQNAQLYAEQNGNNINIHTNISGAWQETTVPVGNAESLNQYNMKENIALYLKNAKNFKEVGADTIDGKDAYKIEGIITGDSIEKVIEGSGMLDNINSLGLSDANLNNLYKNLGNLSMTVWVDKQNSYPVKYEMDMTALMSSVFANIQNLSSGNVDSGIKFDKYITTVTLSNFDQAKNFEIPEEAHDHQ